MGRGPGHEERGFEGRKPTPDISAKVTVVTSLCGGISAGLRTGHHFVLERAEEGAQFLPFARDASGA